MPVSPTDDHDRAASELELSVVIVNYRSWADTQALVAALQSEARAHRLEILVVNNSPEVPPPTGAMAPGTTLLTPERNLGFAGGINFGWQHARGRLLLVLNPDVRPHPGAIGELLSARARYPWAAVWVPRLVHDDGRDQASLRTFYRWETIVAARSPWGLTQRGHRVMVEHMGIELDKTREQTVDWGLGAVMLIDPQRVPPESGRLMDERFFLYLEDVDLCLRAWQSGAEVRYVPRSVFTHFYRRESRRHPWSRLNLLHAWSLLRFVAKYGGLPERPQEHPGDLRHHEGAMTKSAVPL
jgi:GT2 family glycosyltransferase